MILIYPSFQDVLSVLSVCFLTASPDHNFISFLCVDHNICFAAPSSFFFL